MAEMLEFQHDGFTFNVYQANGRKSGLEMLPYQLNVSLKYLLPANPEAGTVY